MLTTKEKSALHYDSINNVNSMIKGLLSEVYIINHNTNRDYDLLCEKLTLLHSLMKVKKYL